MNWILSPRAWEAKVARNKVWENIPESNSVIVWPNRRHNALIAMSGSDVPQDVDMKLPLVLFRVRSHILSINEIPSNVIYRKRLSETLRSFSILRNANLTDLLCGGFGRRTTQFLLECESRTLTITFTT